MAIVFEAIALATAVVLLWLSSLSSYLLFHSVIEVALIAIAAAVFAMAWNLRSVTPNGYAVVIGTGLVFAAALELLHLLAYKGMGVFAADANLATQLWIAARYLTAATFVAAPFFFARRPRVWTASVVYALLDAVLVASIFWWKVFPACYVAPTGLTDFKKASEYVIAGLFVLAALLITVKGKELSRSARALLVAAMLTSTAAEIAFTMYVGVYAFPNLVGHLLVFVSVYLIYRGVVTSGMALTYLQVVAQLRDRSAELEELSVALERRVDERTAELNAAVAELETISYSVSHELRSPLRAIDGFSALALEEGRDVLSPEAADGLERARGAARRMGELIDALLSLMRLGRGGPHLQDVDVSALAEEVATDLSTAPGTEGVTFEIQPGMRVSADGELLRILLRNLLANAVKFSAGEPQPRVAVRQESQGGAFVVSDNGIGLDPAHAARVFEPFERLVSGSDYEGTGIGLALVRRIVVLHGGDVEIDGAPGQGATVRFRLAPDGRPGRQRSASSSETVTNS